MTGFDIATVSGPLCEEPMLGAVFLIENIELVKKAGDIKVGDFSSPTGLQEEEKQDSYGNFNG